MYIWYVEQKKHAFAKDKLNTYASHQEPLYSGVTSQKLAWFGHSNSCHPLKGNPLGNRWEQTEKRNVEKLLNCNIKEWTRHSYSTILAFLRTEMLRIYNTDSSVMTPLWLVSGVTRWDGKTILKEPYWREKFKVGMPEIGNNVSEKTTSRTNSSLEECTSRTRNRKRWRYAAASLCCGVFCFCPN